MAFFEEKENICKSIIVHPLADFSSSYPSLFVWDLKQNFIHGQGKSTAKFHALRKQIIQSLPSSPAPGPATFVIRCLEALSLIEAPYCEGLGHLLTSALNRAGMGSRFPEDSAMAKMLAASLVCKSLKSGKNLNHRLIVKTIEVFNVQMGDIAKVLSIGITNRTTQAETFVDSLVVSLIKIHSYSIALSLIKHLQLCYYSSQTFLARMLNDGDLRLAGQWAAHLGKDMLCCLVRYCTEIGMFKEAYNYVHQYQLSNTFPEARHLFKQSFLPSVLVKGSRDREAFSSDDGLHHQKHLRDLALNITNQCDDERSVGCKPSPCTESDARKYLQIADIIPLENIIWIDSIKDLDFASNHLTHVSVVGIDCEWKTIRTETCFINKVSIFQIATHDFVFIFDLITLSQKHPSALSKCIQSLFSSSGVLKLGYAVHQDLEQLFHSYSGLECFHQCDSVLDLQIVAGRGIKGGLSALAKVVLGKSMDKGERMTDWERRPLSMKQLHYAALDAAVLLSIFDHVDLVCRIDWKFHVNHFKSQKTYVKQKSDEVTVESSNSSSDEHQM